jgi:hypothetical protein
MEIILERRLSVVSARVADCMLLTPYGHETKDGAKGFPVAGKGILDARWNLRVDLPGNDVVSLEFSELLSEHFLCWSRQKSL